MKRALLVASALLAAFAVAGPSAARNALPQSDVSTGSLAQSLGLRTLDSRLALVVASGQANGAGAALATARSEGLLVSQGRLRVIVHAREGHVASARAAVRLAHGQVVIVTGTVIEALVVPKSLARLAASKHIAAVRPIEAAVAPTMTGLRLAAAHVALSFSNVTVPGAPTGVTAQAGDGQATVTFTPPASNGGGEILYYTVTAFPGGRSASGTGGSIAVAGLTNGAGYAFTVAAANSAGISASSGFSNVVVPDGPSRLEPNPPSANPRPNVPGFTSSGVRINPHHNIGEY